MGRIPCRAVFLLALGLTGCARVQLAADQTLPLQAENLRRLPREELADRIGRDAAALRHVAEGLEALEAQARALDQAIPRTGREYFTQEENDRIRQLLLSYLGYRTALLRMVAFYSSYEQLSDEPLRLRAFLVGYGAVWTVAQKGAVFLALFRDDPAARRKLNEPEPAFGIPPGVFDTIQANLSRPGNVELLQRAHEQYVKQLPRFEATGVRGEEAFAWIGPDAEKKRLDVRERAPGIWAGSWDQLVAAAGQSAGGAAYRVQSAVATWLGDTRVTAEPPSLTPATVRALIPRLEPGDILVVRHEGYLSNGFLPGHWPHAALYVGTAEELRAAGLADLPAVAARLPAFGRPDRSGNPRRVIEALSEGVVFTSLEEALGADHVAVFRPRLSAQRRRWAVERAFSHYGKRYDFEFDFFSSDKLVCTELVYRAYDEALFGERLDLTLVRLMGRDTFPAQELVKLFKREWLVDQRSSPPRRQLELVAYLAAGKSAPLEALLATVP